MRRASTRALTAAMALVLLVGCQLVDRSTNRPVTKVMLFGDSIMWGAAPAIAKPFTDHGATVGYYGAAATGPLWNDKLWRTWLAYFLDRDKPDLVIIEALGAYPGPNLPAVGGGQAYVTPDGRTVEPDSQLMYDEWRKACQELVDLARSKGASVWWAVTPPALPEAARYGPTIPDRINRLRSLYATELDVPTIDWGAAIAGEPVTSVYADDGAHLVDHGNELVAAYTFDHVVRVLTPTP